MARGSEEPELELDISYSDEEREYGEIQPYEFEPTVSDTSLNDDEFEESQGDAERLQDNSWFVLYYYIM